jgi:hypothetical protein
LIVETKPVLTGGLHGHLDRFLKAFQSLDQGLDARACVGELKRISTIVSLVVKDHRFVVVLTDIDANEIHQLPPRYWYE